MPKHGFLGTSAPLSADLTLVIEFAMALALLGGMLLARHQRYRAHACCQSAVVLLNLLVIALIMAPSFRTQVAPKIPARLGRSFYAVATAHAAVGCIAELLGIYIVLAAGTTILPKRLRLVRYKPWMRTALLIWWLAVLLGLATYARWYPLDASRPTRAPFPAPTVMRELTLADQRIRRFLPAGEYKDVLVHAMDGTSLRLFVVLPVGRQHGSVDSPIPRLNQMDL